MNLLDTPLKVQVSTSLVDKEAILLGCVSILTRQYILTFLLPEY